MRVRGGADAPDGEQVGGPGGDAEGGATHVPQLSADLWEVIIGFGVSSGHVDGIRARRLARLGSGFARVARIHVDNVTPFSAPTLAAGAGNLNNGTYEYGNLLCTEILSDDGTVDYVEEALGFIRDGDFLCAECGMWVAEAAIWDAGFLDPWGYPMCHGTAAYAARELRLRAISTLPTELWHPAEIEAAAHWEETVLKWPGYICGACWREWH